MAEDNLYIELVSLVYATLALDCPIMSGNMKSHIQHEEVGNSFTRISISGPSYDIEKWKRTGEIEHTGEYDYAVSVNNVGAFQGRSKKSRHWANRSIVKACRAIANAYNAEVIVRVEL